MTIIALLLDVLYRIVTRILSVKSNDIRAYTVIFCYLASLIILVYILLFEKENFIIVNSKSLYILSLSCFLYTIFSWFEFRAWRSLEASTMSIFSKITPIVTFIASAFILDESVTPKKIFSALLIIVPIIWVKYEKGTFKWDKGFIYALMCSLSLGLVRIVDKEASNYLSLSIYAFISYIIPGLVLTFVPNFIGLAKMKKEVKSAGWKLAVHSLINVFLFYTLIKALSLGEASKVTIIFSVSSILAVLVAIVVLKEKEKLWVKIIAGVLSFIGVILLKG